MNLEYDQKFEEMKKYIPFLESMIKRLEITNNGVKNPRKAQLDKIRSLRDLLLDKKKRMKMENLLKCEQVLVNLYAKVEQRDSMPENKEDCNDTTENGQSDLNMVRSKLKSVSSKLQDDVPETLPEIARANNTEVVCTPGSKEPALFQRRPNKASPVRGSSGSHKEDHSSNSKRNYTRVLMSPEHKKKDWLVDSDTNNDKPLFSRRSPRRSPRRHSPSYKRERKKSSKQRSKSSQDSKDLNITLKVPEESLGSLNTKDILSRIINCSDSDVDIDTLRGLRTQILGELKQTGSKDDISDLILKSYKKKEKSSKETDEVEEGELSDSESETIENIYGSLVVVDKGERDSNSSKISSDKKQPRKIQICLVINSDKEKEGKINDQTLNTTLDITDFEAYTDNSTVSNASSKLFEGDKTIKESIEKEVIEKENNMSLEEKKAALKIVEENCKSPKQDNNKIEKKDISYKEKPKISSTETFKPNFYQSSIEGKKKTEECIVSQNCNKSIDENRAVTAKPTKVVKNPNPSAKIRTKKQAVSEIDILQALKKEILGETETVPIPEVITPPLHQPKITKVASADEIIPKKRISIENYKQKSVPLIAQPFFRYLNQQSTLKDDNLKKQSLKLTEKECERFNFPVNVSPVDSSEDEDKQKWDDELLHGTPKSPDSKKNEKSPVNFEILRGGSAPKSPDHEDFADTGIRPPVIIPSDPVKNIVPNVKVDIDMRNLMPLISPVTLDGSRKSILSPSLNTEKVHEATWNENGSNNEKIRKSVQEFRVRAESNLPSAKNSPNSYATDSDRGQRTGTNYTTVPTSISSNIPPLMSLNPNSNVISNLNQIMTPILNPSIPLLLNPSMTTNMTPILNPSLGPSMNPNITPNRMIPGMNPMMTPIVTSNSRSYEMTLRPNFDIDDYTNQKHVYAPIFPPFEPQDFAQKDTIQVNQSNESTKWEDRNCRSTAIQRDVDYHRNRNDRYIGDKRLGSPQIRMECPATLNTFGRMDCPSTPNPSFGRIECPPTPNPSFGRMECPSTPNPSFGRMECPSTPNPSFGRMECPSTPNPSFGRMECPSTPNPSFGRMECPATPNPSFGRMECPATPNPSFGRMETQMTPVHSLGRSDCSMTPSHPFGRSDISKTPTKVFGRDYRHSTSSYNHNYIKSHDPRVNRSNDYDKSQSSLYDERTDNANRYRRSQVKPYIQDSHNNRERMLRRESSVGSAVSRDYENDEPYNDYRYRRENYKCSDDLNNKRNCRSKSIGRINSPLRDRGVGKTYTKEESMEKPISVQSHTGRSFNIDTSVNRTFQETKSTSPDKSFNAQRQRASSVGRSLRESTPKDSIEPFTNKNDFFRVSDRKTMQFRRAYSVGRDRIDNNANKNFKDIKNDLRSCKFNNYDFNKRQRDHKSKSHSSYSNEKSSSNEHYSSRDTRISNSTLIKSTGHQYNRDPRRKLRDCDINSTKIANSSKYSPRKNFRDPRMRREMDVKNTSKDRYKDKERHSSSSHNKNNGIVYSNDNIAKGTILASATGVKNFKIPKIKRAVEEKEVENKSQFESDVNNKESFKNKNKVGNSIIDQSKKEENKPIRSGSANADKLHEVENSSNNIAIKVDKPKTKEDMTSISKIPDKVQNHDENTHSVDITPDSSDRRITRSAVKGGTPSKEIDSTSPVNKLRRIKNPLVYDCDSDTRENESINRNIKNSAENDLKMDEQRKHEIGSKIKENDETTSGSKIKENDETTSGSKIKENDETTSGSKIKENDETTSMERSNSTNEDAITTYTNIENNSLNNIGEKSVPVTTKESCEGHNDTLDISFGVDDDLFSDNIASGTVLDNINALIADLDHDIEAPKVNDFNDKFMNNSVGRVSSNNSRIPLIGSGTDFAPDETLQDEVNFVVADVENAEKGCGAQIVNSKEETYKIEATKSQNNFGHVNCLTQSDQIDTQNKCEEIKNNEAKDAESSITENTNEPVFQENVTGSISETEGAPKNLNSDAIVSTTARDEKSDDLSKNLQVSLNDTITCVSPFVPDSTINSNETSPNVNDKDLQEMNISSTNNSNDLPSKEQSANSTCADNLPRMDTISNLLSILEDKNKMKELLTFLSNDTAENKKIKKKLEKLSEIVSDEEENPKDTNCDIKTQNRRCHEVNLRKSDDIVAVADIAVDDIEESETDGNSQSVDATNKLDKESNEGESIILKTPLNDNGIQSYNEKAKKEETTKIDDKIANINKENQLQTDIKTVENKHISDDVVQKTDFSVDEQAKENETLTKYKDLTDTAQEDIHISEGNVTENNLMDTLPAELKSGKKKLKKSKLTKRGRSRLAKNSFLNKDKRVTRSEAGSSQPVQPDVPPVPKKPSRELLKLQEDIRDMFISEDILNATGIRMCRLAKLVDNKISKDQTPKIEVEPEPIVLLENIKNKILSDDSINSIQKNNKRKTISKPNTPNDTLVKVESNPKPKYKPGPKSKTKKQDDPYIFETDSIGESNNTVDSKEQNTDSDSDSVSTKSFGSVEWSAETKKKPKRKRRNWQLGVIKKKGIKIKSAAKSTELITSAEEIDTQETKDKDTNELPDYNCFTDKSYCFHKNVQNYMCRLCGYCGNDIVPHYKKNHPHCEIPLSRLSPGIAKKAIQQCENMNLQVISKIETKKYVCRFCFKDFNRHNTILETFFWHVVSMHTGEYKHLCSECTNISRCPFNLDIPPPPKNVKGQLIGYICGRCNFTQVSLENLKTHVIIRHDDEQTEVYSINLGDIPRKTLESLITKESESSVEGPRLLRSTRSNQSITELSDRSDISDSTDHIDGLDTGRYNPVQDYINKVSPKIVRKDKIQSKFIFENDDSDASSYSKNYEMIKASIKLERDEGYLDSVQNEVLEILEPSKEPVPDPPPPIINKVENATVLTELTSSTGVLDYPHFKIKLTGTGAKEYVCCINGLDNHYRTSLLISLKKHVQFKHSENVWDGYCFVCKLIVTGQGKHTFNDCLQHFLLKHMDNFPIFEEAPQSIVKDDPVLTTSTLCKEATIYKSYINVRPLSELKSTEQSETGEVNPQMSKIQNVAGSSDEPINTEIVEVRKTYNYEEAQSKVMAKKHRVVLEAILRPEKLVHVFKCAGRFCSYTTDDTEEALLHASTHQRIGGECSLMCAYCDFDSSGNAIDLVTHVFKNYNHCAYACSKCFYRAAASALVYAHIKRIHSEFDPSKVPVLNTPTVGQDNLPDEMIPRDEAVLYYVCNNRDPDEGGICGFKTFVSIRFTEHMHTIHPNDQEYPCFMCNITTSTTKLLMEHLKTHGLKIYQCCRCLFGADNELELMEHASERHPLKPPKAYLRIVVSKSDSPDTKVLPLGVLPGDLTRVLNVVVTPCLNKESPVKEAERSIDLEKLIGLTNLTIESRSTITNAATIEPSDVTENIRQIQLEEEQTCETSEVGAERSSPAVLTLVRDSQDTLNKPNDIVKSEPVETENSTLRILPVTPISAPSAQPQSDVVCVDSDDDSSRQNIIDLSVEETPVELNSTEEHPLVTDIKLPRTQLYKCSKCFIVSKSEGMFKRHIISCIRDSKKIIQCAHCSYNCAANEILDHYNSKHVDSPIRYICGICKAKYVGLSHITMHMNMVHHESSTTVKTKTSSTGVLQHFLVAVKERQTPKRKLSGDTAHRNSEPAPKLKKYGPQDVEKLPINPILDDLVYCCLCEYSTKVRLNMVRHLQLHAEQQPVPRIAPVNPVPHLESNEKHFDKMVNLASSSITTSNKHVKDGTTTTFEYVSPDAAASYPKYVPDKHRYTCGAKGCSYISVNETMLKIHWETLHTGTDNYRCVHCPPHQQLNTIKPLTAMRIIAHLKMHGEKLYACSSCAFYHYTRKYINKHIKAVHEGKILIVREGGTLLPPIPPSPVQATPAPTMDLKLWQCGLCKFKSMIRPEVIEHCSKFHQSKMQFKCMYCGFRTSNIENISKHQSKQHPGKKEEVFYFYYREGSIPDEADGTARWQKQSQKSESEIKTETDIPPPESIPILPQAAQAKPPNLVNLDIVKKEVIESDTNVLTEDVENLCQTFGEFCDPNGLKYKCSLCKVIIEDTKEGMQSHLYEELQYRKWGCALCSYKAFHKPGLQQHVQTEHRHSREAREPIELQVDFRIEAWVTKLLEYQTAIIDRNKANLVKQKIEILRSNPGTSNKAPEKPVESPMNATKPNMSMAELEKLFGPFGVPNNMNYTCPKCNISARAEAVMQEHLEGELNKIRWCCNICSETFQTYHEAQFHCRSVHQGQSSRPVEATRDVGLRAAWVAAVLRVQKLSMNFMPVTETPTPDIPAQQTDNLPENSLLVVRYEEKVPTPEEQMKLNKKTDKDVFKIATDDTEKKKAEFACNYCLATYKQESFFQGHVLKHYGLKPFTCPYCPHTDQKRTMEFHIKNQHPNKTVIYMATSIPANPPVHDYLKHTSSTSKTVVIDIESKIICLGCEESMTRAESQNHLHDNTRPQFGMRGAVVYRCWTCLTLHKTSHDFSMHHKQYHAAEKKNSSFYKLADEIRSLFCSLCNQNFINMAQYRLHQQVKHGLKSVMPIEPSVPDFVIELDDEVEGGKRKASDSTILPVRKRVAKKSTTKLPTPMGVARKSTTKLPFNVPCDDEEYSFYGTRPSVDNLENVTTLMPFYNTFVPFTLQKLSDILKIYPQVIVKDINKQW